MTTTFGRMSWVAPPPAEPKPATRARRLPATARSAARPALEERVARKPVLVSAGSAERQIRLAGGGDPEREGLEQHPLVRRVRVAVGEREAGHHGGGASPGERGENRERAARAD